MSMGQNPAMTGLCEGQVRGQRGQGEGQRGLSGGQWGQDGQPPGKACTTWSGSLGSSDFQQGV